VPTYRIPLASVPSPDNLTPLAGNVYALGVDSGDLQVDFPRSGGFGTLVSSALEQSTVDLASELTAMIESERNYTANSKVFQTGAELMDVLVNLKR
jgi:flagellar hook protein FlgE